MNLRCESAGHALQLDYQDDAIVCVRCAYSIHGTTLKAGDPITVRIESMSHGVARCLKKHDQVCREGAQRVE